MEHILIKIKDKNKTELLIEVLSKFDFLEIETNINTNKEGVRKKKAPEKAFTTEQQKFIHGLKQAFNEVELHQKGKLKLKTFDDFIKEL